VERLIDMAEQLATSDNEDTRRWALQWLSERGHGKVTDKLEVSRGDDDEQDEEDLDSLSTEQLRELVAAERDYDARRSAILGTAMQGNALLVAGTRPTADEQDH
jgi:hypothetical protein